jgi:uncharacterized protein
MAHSELISSVPIRATILLCVMALGGCRDATGPTGKWRAHDFFKDPKVVALCLAAGKGDVETVDRLVTDRVDVNARGKDGMTPLLWAMWAKSKRGFLCLLEHGADPNIQLDDGDSVTSYAAAAANDSEWLEVILKHGANPNLVNSKRGVFPGQTPLWDAIRSRKMKHLNVLIQAGVDVNHRDQGGETAMIYAAGLNWFDSVFRLLEAGADFRLKNDNGTDLAYRLIDTRVDPNSDLGRWREKAVKFLEAKGVDFAPIRAVVAEKERKLREQIRERNESLNPKTQN